MLGRYFGRLVLILFQNTQSNPEHFVKIVFYKIFVYATRLDKSFRIQTLTKTKNKDKIM